ncbi:hypothetical protein HUU53_04815 [Candidatus Micrarchaeota archaeon]|nr:hypothetical protein [Candidatus Micrarchaeota archaeon]
MKLVRELHDYLKQLVPSEGNGFLYAPFFRFENGRVFVTHVVQVNGLPHEAINKFGARKQFVNGLSGRIKSDLKQKVIVAKLDSGKLRFAELYSVTQELAGLKSWFAKDRRLKKPVFVNYLSEHFPEYEKHFHEMIVD